MRFPSITYAFQRPTDTNSPTALIVSRHFQQSSADSLIEFFLSDLPKDRVIVVTNVSMAAQPGGAQAVGEMKIQGLSQGVENFNIAQNLFPDVPQPRTLDWQGEVYIQGGGPGTNSVRIFAAFVGAVAANTVTVGLHGIIIPRGNFGGF